MNPLKAIQNASILVRCAALSIAVAALCTLIVFGPQQQVETTTVVAVVEREPITWRQDPYVRIRVTNLDTFDYQIDELTPHGPVHLAYNFDLPAEPISKTVAWPTVDADDPMGDKLYAIRVLHDSTDLANHVENFFVDEVMANDPRATLMYVVKTGKSTWITTIGLAATREIALKDLPDTAQSELHLQGTLSTDSSAFHYDSVTVKVNGVVLARVDASYSRPILHMPAACLKGDEAVNANYIVIFGNDGGYIVVAKSFELRGKADSDIQLCWINGQKGALKALRTVAAEFEGMAHGNEVVWHEPTKATVLSADFNSPPAKPNNNH